MAKQRYINTRLWRDTYVENLDPTEKLQFIYLLTNPDTNISGIYELPLKIIAVDIGIDKEMVLKIFSRFEQEQKAKYDSGWVAIKNFTKHQSMSPKIKAGIIAELRDAPEKMIKWVNLHPEIEYLYGIDKVSHLNSNSNSNINSNKAWELCISCAKNGGAGYMDLPDNIRGVLEAVGSMRELRTGNDFVVNKIKKAFLHQMISVGKS